MSSVEEVFKSMKTVSSFYATTITFATSIISTHCSKPSGVLRVTHFSQKTGNMERHLVTCSDRVKHIYPKNVYELRETLFEKLDAFNIPYRNEQRLFKKLAIFDCESICVKEDSYKQTETTTWIGKHVPISVFISSNLIPEPIFLCNANPHHLISSFITAPKRLATQSKAKLQLDFIEIKAAIKTKLCVIFEQFNQRHNQAERVSNFVDDCIVEEEEEKDLSTQFLQMQKNQLIDLQEHFERYCNVYQSLDSTAQNTILI